VNTRQVATGTVLTASLLFGGAGLAAASPGSQDAQDRGNVCEAWEHRLDGLGNAIAQMERRHDRLSAALADAQADGDARRAQRIETQLAQVDRVVARLTAAADRLNDAYEDRCDPFVQPE
jgi:hypothetical protein